MQLVYPPPFGADNNPHRTDPVDEFLQYPYNCCGRQTEFPCRGYLKLLGTPQGAPTASWPAGSEQSWSIAGIGNHYGGSCQVGFSIDQGKTWQVATSYHGNCPHRNGGNDASGQNFKFTVPADMPNGEAVFAWTWYNREQEFNMNCAAVKITGGQEFAEKKDSAPAYAAPTDKKPGLLATESTYTDSNGCTCSCPANPISKRALGYHALHGGVHIKRSGDQHQKRTGTAYANRPSMMFAAIDEGCSTPQTSAETKFANPGPEVVEGDGEYPLELPTGNCEQ
ncbi:MAG: hypothetical protein M1833_002068 [Piccolia ochrophora]|nr:MAG: hypothetical protein M1833_002068 [Piccolia ochrophora]